MFPGTLEGDSTNVDVQTLVPFWTQSLKIIPCFSYISIIYFVSLMSLLLLVPFQLSPLALSYIRKFCQKIFNKISKTKHGSWIYLVY